MPADPKRRIARKGRLRRRPAVNGHSQGAVRGRIQEVRHLLHETSMRHFYLFDVAPIGYAILDVQGNILSLNMTLTTILGQSRAYMEGMPMGLAVVPEDRDLFHKHVRTCLLSTTSSVTCDVTLMGSMRRVIPVHLISRRVFFSK